jgi:hypothetical protein
MFPDAFLTGRFKHYTRTANGESCLFEHDDLETLIRHIAEWIAENPARSNTHLDYKWSDALGRSVPIYQASNNRIVDSETGQNASVIQWEDSQRRTLRVITRRTRRRYFPTENYMSYSWEDWNEVV